MLYVQRDDPDYNLLLRTAPTQLTDVERLTGRNDVDNWYRWHIEVIPHHAVTSTAFPSAALAGSSAAVTLSFLLVSSATFVSFAAFFCSAAGLRVL